MNKKRVAIIGAGLGGLLAAIRLKQAGHTDIQIFDRNERIGGTWAENQYPGSQCDIPILLYQYSFFPSMSWSRLFASAPEIQRYCEEVADTFELRDCIHVAESVTLARWNEASNSWSLETDKGRKLEVDVVVGALGQLNRPQWPDINGLETFDGPAMHSARWDHSVDFTGKRVGVIGSAASAVQIIPQLAKIASHVSVFQRTPNWVLPRNDRAVPPEEVALMMTHPEKAQELMETGRRSIYETADYFAWQMFQWTPEGRGAYTQQALNHLHEQVEDADLIEKLTPHYPIGCKRVLLSDDYYPALQKPHVELVTDAIEEIVPSGVVTNNGNLHELDILVFATGFETTEWKWSVDIVGEGGRHLNQVWQAAPEAYLGVGVSGFPNLFVMYGPNTNLGHNSITFMLECQADYIVNALQAIDSAGAVALSPKQAVQDAFNEKLQQELSKTAWADPATNSWYRNKHGRITQNWSSHTRDYAAATAEIRLDEYDLRF